MNTDSPKFVVYLADEKVLTLFINISIPKKLTLKYIDFSQQQDWYIDINHNFKDARYSEIINGAFDNFTEKLFLLYEFDYEIYFLTLNSTNGDNLNQSYIFTERYRYSCSVGDLFKLFDKSLYMRINCRDDSMLMIYSISDRVWSAYSISERYWFTIGFSQQTLHVLGTNSRNVVDYWQIPRRVITSLFRFKLYEDEPMLPTDGIITEKRFEYLHFESHDVVNDTDPTTMNYTFEDSYVNSPEVSFNLEPVNKMIAISRLINLTDDYI